MLLAKNNTSVSTDKNFSDRFVKGLLQWNRTLNQRKMPWKGEKDPFKIWLSEVILQQTRVEQGLNYYERFIKTYPTITALANAPEQEVFKLWEGLGYYSRCKNLLSSAKYVSEQLQGVFPKDYLSILALKGVGNYTAAAIASFAYNEPYAVLDGNVFRILSRIFDVETPIDTVAGKKLFSSLAQSILPVKKAGEYNQAIMDFGATVCKPVPECSACFFNKNCEAFLQKKQLLLPVKSKRISVKERWFNYVVLKHNNSYAVHLRKDKDIWQNLFQFPLIESNKKISPKKLLPELEQRFSVKENQYHITGDINHSKQRLSHQIIHFQFIKAEVYEQCFLPAGFTWINANKLKNLPFPKTLQQYLLSLF